MNYRHAFHAGNHADVLKHFILSRVLGLLGRKETPLAYLDSHSGLGLYDLMGDQATRTGEWREGIARLWAAFDVPAPLTSYLDIVRDMNPDGELRFYPGSPEVARRLTRPQDRLLFNEWHPDDGQLLKANMAQDRRTVIHQRDGWLLPKALLPTQEKRAVLLVDPPFEQADDWTRCALALKESIGRMRQSVAMIWYPIKDQRQLKRFYQELQKSGAPKLLRAELSVHPVDNPIGLNGSGMAIANPPWGLEEELRQVLPWLAKQLCQSQSGWRLDWLIEERPA
ncbi:23S rRNA (adenine2030-N6)-methyltransferase [Pseudomonas duriflava]|uniref:Ribosomal RNA large subunit methyltransferase J n=1 Tax=Pseudomonas duriflava TaxID=459528 RepID=A0A562QDE9_9PSED|nr:23S rRNA (adenine(2030)-N(6))-methyltransferase RlmJ [Pseudomonas duriflava]TWI54190.1 23S rRNA (adenine2030-N6)-methyltransferase [Pseudomonas duriflava]